MPSAGSGEATGLEGDSQGLIILGRITGLFGVSGWVRVFSIRNRAKISSITRLGVYAGTGLGKFTSSVTEGATARAWWRD